LKHFLALFFLLCSYGLYANDSTNFFLVAKSGKVSFHENQGKGWHTISEKDTIAPNSSIRIEKFSYLLIKSGKGYLEFNIAGTYNLSEYGEYLKPGVPIVQQYEQIILDSLKIPAKTAKGQYAKELLDAKTDGRDLLSVYPPPTIIYDREITLRWRPMDNNIYIVRMYHSELSQYFYREVKGDQVTVDMIGLNFPTDRCIYWSVGIKGSEYWSVPKCVYILNIGESSNIILPAYALEEDLNLERSAYHNLMMAFYYESEKVQHKAELYYEKAWSLSNNNPRYKQLYYDFLKRRNSVVID